MKIKQGVIWIIIVAIAVRESRIAYARLLDDFTCSEEAQDTKISPANLISNSDWTIGFWLKVEYSSSSVPIMRIESTLLDSPQYVGISPIPPNSYSLFVDDVYNFSFIASKLDDSLYDYIRKDQANVWNYVTFSYKYSAPVMLIKRAINSQIGFSLNTSKIYSTENTAFVISTMVGASVCMVPFRILKLDLIEGAYHSSYGASKDPSNLFYLGTGGYVVLYKLNSLPSDQRFLNIVNPKMFNGVLKTPISLLEDLPLPRNTSPSFTRWQTDRTGYRIVVPSGFVSAAPAVTGYTFFVSYKAYGNQIYFSQSPIITIYLYLRKDKSETTNRFTLFLHVHRNNWIHTFLETPPSSRSFEVLNYTAPAQQTTFLIQPLTWAGLVVKNSVFLPKPTVKYIRGSTVFIASPDYPLSTDLCDSDVHLVMYSLNNNFVTLVVGEVAFLHTTNLQFDTVTRTLINDNSLNPFIVHSADNMDLKRVVNSSFDSIDLNTNADIETNNCGTFTPNICDYCQQNVCLACKYPSYMIDDECHGVCDIDDVYDSLSKTCEKANKINIPNITAFLPTLNTLAQTRIVVINVTFEVKINLTTGDPVYNTYFSSFNSLQNTAYNPMVTTSYTVGQISSGLTNLQKIFTKFALTFPMFVSPESITYTYTAKNPSTYIIHNPLAARLNNICYSTSLIYNEVSKFKGRCLSSCFPGLYFDNNLNICKRCDELCHHSNLSIFCQFCDKSLSFSPSDDHSSSDNQTKAGQAKQPSKIITSILSEIKSASNTKIIPNGDECSKGYFYWNGRCEECIENCLSCPNTKTCSKCDSNFSLESDLSCKAINSILQLPLPVNWVAIACSKCSQKKERVDPSCHICNQLCHCSLTKSAEAHTFFFYCDDVVFDLEYLLKATKYDRYIKHKIYQHNGFILMVKPGRTPLTYRLDEEFIESTKNCFVDKNAIYRIDNSGNNFLLPDTNLSELQRKWILIGVDVALMILSCLHYSLANAIIGFLQFNKIYLYLSFSDLKFGSLSNYINSNFYRYPIDELGIMISENHGNLYRQEFQINKGEQLYSNALIVSIMIFTFLGVGLGFIGATVKSYSAKFTKFNKGAQFLGDRILDFAAFQFAHIIVANLSLILGTISLMQSSFLQGIYFVTLSVVLCFFAYIRFQALLFCRNSYLSTKNCFRSLNSQKELSLDQEIITNRSIDEGLLCLKSLILMSCISLTKFMLFSSLVISTVEFVISLTYYGKINRSLSILKTSGVLLVWTFTFILILNSFGFEFSTLALDICHILALVTKAAESIGIIAYIFYKNRLFAQSLNRVCVA
jgi:hypothetical protein